MPFLSCWCEVDFTPSSHVLYSHPFGPVHTIDLYKPCYCSAKITFTAKKVCSPVRKTNCEQWKTYYFRNIFEIFSVFFLTLTERLTHGKHFVFWQTFCFTVVNTLFTGGLRNIVFTEVFHHRTRVFSHFPGQQIHVNARKRLVLGCSPIA